MESYPVATQPPPAPETTGSKAKKVVGPIAVAGAVILKFLGQIKFFLPVLLKTGGTMLLTIGAYAMVWGWRFALGFVLLIFVHECGHLIVARRFGLKVSAPMFIPFMGAFIALKEAPRNAWMESNVGIGGPIFGTLGAIVCHLLGVYLNIPLLIAIAWSGYFLNLFNLAPAGMLDGGRIVTALSPWLWLPGFALLAWLAWTRPNLIIWLVLVMALPRIFSLFRRRTAEEQRYFEVTPAQRATMGVMYFGLAALLVLGMHIAQEQIHAQPHPRAQNSTVVE